jgi:hypothetical protein
LSDYDRRSITIETGIQNSGLGLVLIFAFFGGLGGMAVSAACGVSGMRSPVSRWPRCGRAARPADETRTGHGSLPAQSGRCCIQELAAAGVETLATDIRRHEDMPDGVGS